jgi:hypothetical protein
VTPETPVSQTLSIVAVIDLETSLRGTLTRRAAAT